MGFSLSDLKPKSKQEFELGDGRVIYFRNRLTFDMMELGAFTQYRNSIIDAGKLRNDARTDEQMARASQKYNTACREMIGLVLPDLPNDMLSDLNAGQIDRLANWCINAADGVYDLSLPKPEDLEAVRNLFPDIPESFLRTLSRDQVANLLPEKAEAEAEKN